MTRAPVAGVLLAAGALCAALLTGCTATPEPAPAELENSLRTLRKLDDQPLWTMRYAGGYDRLKGVATPQPATPFGCSLFAAYGDPANPVFARNFDWDDNPALLLFTDPPDGHASVSMVDTAYLGVEGDPDTDAERKALADAPLLPFDGMNEKGLAIGMAAVPDGSADNRPERPTVGSVRIIRLVLDRAGTVDEALRVFEGHNVDFTGGPPLHYLIADRYGTSAVVEFVDGRLVSQRSQERWNAAVNFTLHGTGRQQRESDWRYRTASRRLESARGRLAWTEAMQLLEQVAQQHTRWSVVYGLRSGDVRLVTAKRFSTVHDFRLPMS
jgi:hypothetical protein